VISGAGVEMLQALHALHRPRKDEFFQLTTRRRAALFTNIKVSRNELLDEVFARIHAVRPESQPIFQLQTKIYRYFDFSDWSLIDMIALAVCAPATEQQVARSVAPNALLYHCLRMLDDVLDGHEDYKGGAPTLLGELNSQPDTRPLAFAGNLLPLMILAMQSGATLPDEDRRLYERTMIGMLHEAFAPDWRAEGGYRRIAEAKMGAYGMFLYRPVVSLFDPEIGKTLEPFLARSFYLSQLMNDLNDQPGDETRQQPNFWLSGRNPEVASTEFMEEIGALSRACSEVSPLVRPYAHARVTDLIGYCLQVIQASDQNRPNWPIQAS
jgi:hypothetical protein